MTDSAISLLAVALGGLVVLTIGVYMRLGETGLRQRTLPRGFSSPVVAMQMARSMQEIGLIIGEPGHDVRLRMRRLQFIDCFFVCAYWLEFVMIGYLMSQRGFPLTKPLGVATMLCGTLTALFDIRENLAILKVLPMSVVPEYDRLVRAVNAAATRKWWFFSITMILISFAFIGKEDFRTVTGQLLLLASLSFLVTGTVGLIGSWRSDATLERTAGPMVLGLTLVVAATIWGTL